MPGRSRASPATSPLIPEGKGSSGMREFAQLALGLAIVSASVAAKSEQVITIGAGMQTCTRTASTENLVSEFGYLPVPIAFTGAVERAETVLPRQVPSAGLRSRSGRDPCINGASPPPCSPGGLLRPPEFAKWQDGSPTCRPAGMTANSTVPSHPSSQRSQAQPVISFVVLRTQTAEDPVATGPS
jgi:hypothetical protein